VKYSASVYVPFRFALVKGFAPFPMVFKDLPARKRFSAASFDARAAFPESRRRVWGIFATEV